MSNTFYIIAYAILAFCSMTIIGLTLSKKRRSKLDASLLFVAAMLLGWDLSLICYFLATDFEVVRFLYDIRLPFVSLVALSWFLYIIRFYGVERSFPKPLTVALFIIPIFTFVLVLLTPWHDYIRSVLVILETTPMHIYYMERGPWFWFHSTYCYLLIIAAFIIAVRQHTKTPKEYRKPSTLLLAGLIVSTLGNVAVIATNTELDLSLIAATGSAILLYLATRNYQGLSFLIQARNEAFHHIKEAIFILDSNEDIINMNKSARNLLLRLGISAKKKAFPVIIRQMIERSEKCITLDDLDSGTDYYLANGTVLNFRNKPILDNEGNPIGSFAFASNETNNRELIEYLDKHSGIDALTGLANRRKIEDGARILDEEKNYPLAILYGDLNNLKETNDTFGHQQGDVLLRLVAEALKSTCPPSSRIGRIGGDEFIVLLPNHDETQTSDLCADIREYLERERDRYLFDPSIALGFAIKRAGSERLIDIANIADANMYADKQRMKAAMTN